jgi:outer membrane murein-binding lipoprotein Lpp
MKNHNKYLLIAVLIVNLGLFGCTSSELEEETKHELKEAKEEISVLESALKDANEKIESAKSENRKLSDQIAEVQESFEKLRIANSILATSYEEMEAWTKKLVDGYGPGLWYFDESIHPVFVKSMKSSDVKGIIQELNKRFQEDHLPRIILQKIADKRVYVGVEDEDLLTQRMGSYGATSYINTVIYSITSLEDIDCVCFDLVEGDHAVSGEYCR